MLYSAGSNLIGRIEDADDGQAAYGWSGDHCARCTRPIQPHGATAAGPADSDLVRAARGLPVSRTPVWFMRQAGRSLPEYRALRAGTAMLEACQDPDLVTEIP